MPHPGTDSTPTPTISIPASGTSGRIEPIAHTPECVGISQANNHHGIPMPKRLAPALCLGLLLTTATWAEDAPMDPLRPDQTAFRALYKELVETNTTLSAGSCTAAAELIAGHLRETVQ